MKATKCKINIFKSDLALKKRLLVDERIIRKLSKKLLSSK